MLRLKEILNNKGMTGKQLADILGVTPQYISGIARGSGSASVDVLAKIAKVLDVPLSSLFADYHAGKGCVCPHCGKEIQIELK